MCFLYFELFKIGLKTHLILTFISHNNLMNIGYQKYYILELLWLHLFYYEAVVKLFKLVCYNKNV